MNADQSQEDVGERKKGEGTAGENGILYVQSCKRKTEQATVTANHHINGERVIHTLLLMRIGLWHWESLTSGFLATKLPFGFSSERGFSVSRQFTLACDEKPFSFREEAFSVNYLLKKAINQAPLLHDG